jgi:hypothetical protein
VRINICVYAIIFAVASLHIPYAKAQDNPTAKPTNLAALVLKIPERPPMSVPAASDTDHNCKCYTTKRDGAAAYYACITAKDCLAAGGSCRGNC